MLSFRLWRRLKLKPTAAIVLLLLVCVAGCRRDDESKPTPTTQPTPDTRPAEATDAPDPSTPVPTPLEVEPTPIPSPTPVVEPKVLVVCMATEPADLYLYGADTPAKKGILHGIYENLVTNLGYAYQAQGLEKLPDIDDGDAVIDQVAVSAGDRVVNAAGVVVLLAEGEEVVNAAGERVTFGEDTVLMSQMTVDFRFRPLTWEDGEPVTADDSVFSFEITADPDSRVPHFDTERTERYEAVDESTVRWTGVPGYLDREYFLNVWSPLPRHVLGSHDVAELAALEAATRLPLAHGPFRLAEWTPGEQLTLVRNEHYYLADEGLPRVDQVTFRFLPEPGAVVDELLAGACDIAYQDGVGSGDLEVLEEASTVQSIELVVQSDTFMEHLDFGIVPSEAYAAGRPDWFGEAEVRQAIAHCIDRGALLDSVFTGYGETLDAYVPANHPLFPADGVIWAPDPDAGNALLDEAGYLDRDGDGVREATDGTPFAVNLLTASGAELWSTTAELIAANLAGCGIAVTVETVPGDRLFSPGPDGPLFGRQFDLALFTWIVHTDPVCEIYEGRQVPGPIPDFPEGWTGNNVTGWQNAAYDEACETALATLSGTDEHVEAHQAALRIFMEELPSLPLFLRIKIAAVSTAVQNFQLDPSEPSALWNLYDLDVVRE